MTTWATSRSGKALLFLLLLATSLVEARPSSASEGWPRAARDWAEDFSREESFSDGSIFTLWGAVKSKTVLGWPGATRARRFRDPSFQGALEIPFLLHRRSQKVERRPLIVFFPGMFNAVRSSSVYRALGRYYRMGFHVVALPNPWGQDYIKAVPKATPGVFDEEARVAYRYLAAVVKAIGRENIARVHIVGESYGGFLGAVVLAEDARSRRPMIDGTVSLYGPPLRVGKSMQRLDRLIDETDASWRRRCNGLARLANFGLDLLHAVTQLQVSENTRYCSEAVVLHQGFQGNLADRTKLLDRVRGMGIVPRANATTWLRNLRFAEYLRRFSPATRRLVNDERKQDLGYWLDFARDRHPYPIRVLSAEDDFLNDPADWRKNQYFDFDSEHFILLPDGGHLGYLEHDRFRDFLEAAYF